MADDLNRPSILDTDLYKLTMGQAVLKKFPNVHAKYKFVNRRSSEQPVTKVMAEYISSHVWSYGRADLTDDEELFLREKCPYLDGWYIEWLKQFRPNPRHVTVTPTDIGTEITVEGPWCETIYWEVPLLAIITEQIMAQQPERPNWDLQRDMAITKAGKMLAAGCYFADFGTRRRYSKALHDMIVATLAKFPSFIGTSNVQLAMRRGVKPIGTMAHEWIQAVSALVGLRHANRFAMEAWNDVYEGNLGIALTDTFGSNAFIHDFDGKLARLFDGVRHDSGDPYEFTRRMIHHYKWLRIDPMSKSVVYSDSLDIDKCIHLMETFKNQIKMSFGIGTHLTNDVPHTMPANIVIKLVEVDNIPVVKLSDDVSKAIGDKQALDVARWTFGI